MKTVILLGTSVAAAGFLVNVPEVTADTRPKKSLVNDDAEERFNSMTGPYILERKISGAGGGIERIDTRTGDECSVTFRQGNSNLWVCVLK